MDILKIKQFLSDGNGNGSGNGNGYGYGYGSGNGYRRSPIRNARGLQSFKPLNITPGAALPAERSFI